MTVPVVPGRGAILGSMALTLLVVLAYFFRGWTSMVLALLAGLSGYWVGIQYGRDFMEHHGINPADLQDPRDMEEWS